jgi:hypothetical protein
LDNGGDSSQTGVRRRRTRRHRRNRLIRRLLAGLVLTCFAAGLSTVALRYLSPSLSHSSSKDPTIDRQHAEDARDRLLQATEDALRPKPSTDKDRPVYAYSVVPGGVEDARELKWVAEHDPIVAAHYAGFDYDHARVVRLTLAQTVYVSYRIGNHVYWTRHRIALHKGEKLITDGKITARARCGNRVEEVPQQLHSAPEPPAAKFEEPIAPSGSSTSIPPVEFTSALLNRPGVGGVEPLPPLSLYTPITGGTFVPISPPPLPLGVCSPVKKPGIAESVTGKKKKNPCATGGGGKTPEPGTWLLLLTGLAAIWWFAKRKVVAIPS